MALSQALIDKLNRHFSGQENSDQSVEFWQLVETNPEFLQAFQQHSIDAVSERSAHHAKERLAQFKIMEEEDYAFLAQRLDTPEMSSQPVIDENTPAVIPSKPSWFSQLTGQLNDWLGSVADGVKTALQPQWRPQLAYAIPLVFLLALGGRWAWQNEQDKQQLAQLGDPLGGPMDAAGEATAPCSVTLQNEFYSYSSATEVKEIEDRIEKLGKLKLSEPCRAYYLGRAYIWKRDYEEAEAKLKTAREKGDLVTQELATYDLALCYLLMDDKTNAQKMLNSRPTWSTDMLRTNVGELRKLAESN